MSEVCCCCCGPVRHVLLCQVDSVLSSVIDLVTMVTIVMPTIATWCFYGSVHLTLSCVTIQGFRVNLLKLPYGSVSC